MSKKQMCLNYKQYNQRLQDNGDMAFQNVTVEEECPTIDGILASPLAQCITFVANNFGYSGTA